MHVADFETGTLSIQTARSQGGQASLVRQHRQRIGLINDLRKFTASEEVLDCGGNALGINQATRRHVLGVFEAHPFLYGPPQFEEAFAQFIRG